MRSWVLKKIPVIFSIPLQIKCSWVLKKIPAWESAFGGLEALIEQGLEEDAVLEGQRDVKVDAIVEEVGEVLGV